MVVSAGAQRVAHTRGFEMRRIALMRGVVLANVACALIALPAALPAQAPAAAPADPPRSVVPPNVDLNAATEFGYGIFQQKCLNCHGKPEYEKAPPPATLFQYTPERIYESLTTGVMAPVIGAQLSDAEKKAVSETITGQRLGAAGSGDADRMPNRCASNPPLQKAAKRPAWNGWGVDPQNTRFQSAAAAGLSAADVPKLKLKWAFGLPNSTSAYAQPSMMFGRVFIGADTGYIYALDANTGCVHWSFNAGRAVRTAMAIGRVKVPGSSGYAVFFGDRQANVYAVDAHSGKLLWTAHPEENFTARVTAAPTYYDGRIYVPMSSFEEFSAATPTYECCKSLGGVAALDANTGKKLWLTHVVPDLPRPTHKNSLGVQQWGPAGGAVWNSPTVDPVRHAVYFGTGDATTYPAIDTSDAVMALNMDTGKVLWSHQVHRNDSFLVGCGDRRTENCPKVVGPDWDIPASPVLKTLPDGSRRIIVVTKPGDVLALDPDKRGALVWRMNVFGPVIGDGPAPKGMSTAGIFWGAAINDRTAYFGLTRGGIGALDITAGKMLWTNPLNTDKQVSYASATTAFPGVVLQGSSDGRVQAVSTTDGKLLWSFETMREFDTVNEVKAHGGSISAPGPIVADGIVLVGSGYAILGGTPGNVLLAFSAQ